MEYAFEPLSRRRRETIIDIFNYFVENSYAAYPERAVGYDFFDYLYVEGRDYPAFAITNEAAEVIGFGFMRPYDLVESFRHVAEVTYFILPAYTGQGVGTAMLRLFVDHALKTGISSLLANICSLNEASISFHLKNGFREWGRFFRVGTKFGVEFDVVWMQKLLNEHWTG